MLDTDYPYFPPSPRDLAPKPKAQPLQNLSGVAACELLFFVKKCAKNAAKSPLSRLKISVCTQVRERGASSRGHRADEAIG